MNHPSDNTPSRDYRAVIYLVVGLLGMLLISDFLIPGKVFNEEIIEIESNRQQYYNAGGNSHMSYGIVTKEHAFNVSEDFADLIKLGIEVEYSVSGIFGEINWYRLAPLKSETHTLRIFTGLLIPIIVLAAMAFSYFSKRRMETLIFVLQVLLIADFVFLMM